MYIIGATLGMAALADGRNWARPQRRPNGIHLAEQVVFAR